MKEYITKLKAIRVGKNMTQMELQSACGVSASVISKLERHLQKPAPEQEQKISEFLGCPKSEWFKKLTKEDATEVNTLQDQNAQKTHKITPRQTALKMAIGEIEDAYSDIDHMKELPSDKKRLEEVAKFFFALGHDFKDQTDVGLEWLTSFATELNKLNIFSYSELFHFIAYMDSKNKGVLTDHDIHFVLKIAGVEKEK